MKSEDFIQIFYSNYKPGIDWENIKEVTWMYENNLFSLSSEVVLTNEEFLKRLDTVPISMDYKLIKNGESDAHMVLKSIAIDYLTERLNTARLDIRIEYSLIGFEVDVIDKDLHFPIECGDTNALKLEKYLTIPTTKKFFIIPYPHTLDVKLFTFTALPDFFKYVKHKRDFFNKQNAKYR